MQFTVLLIGKTSTSYITEGLEIFIDRFRHYHPIKIITLPDIKDRKNLSPDQLKEKEATAFMQNIPKSSIVILLDEKGIEYRSVEFAAFIQKQLNTGAKEIVFIIGGAYGVAQSIIQAANFKIALSQMTFTHQFIRLMLMEQLYRAMTILKNEPYHNE
jgi:23S rRNA (pseudouridine1915-N3)-methyltransferase